MTTASSLPPRTARIERKTAETQVTVELGLDPAPAAPPSLAINTPVGFLSHMLDALGRHGGLALKVAVQGDTHIDDHHTVEDTGIAIGQALAAALGDCRGIRRFATAHVPLDGSLVRAVIDVSGRSTLLYNLPLEPAAGDAKFDFSLFADFFKGLVDHARITLHVDLVRGDHSNHHRVEAAVKAFAVALREAVQRREGASEIPSTKGSL
ncbi:MAG: imidazoleglycerol-phosphate dehydratase HisB [Planctomycetota bacterium]